MEVNILDIKDEEDSYITYKRHEQLLVKLKSKIPLPTLFRLFKAKTKF